MYGEVFQDELDARREGLGFPNEVFETGSDGASYLSNNIYEECAGDDELFAIGFKLFYMQAREPGARTAWRYLMHHRNLRIVHLTRDNLLEAFVSFVEARASGRWLSEVDKLLRGAPMHVDTDECLAFLDQIYSYRGWANQAFCQHQVFELSYERHLIADFGSAMTQVQKFLGVPPLRLPVLLRKQGTAPIETRVINFDEVRRALRHTIHAIK